jgi:hypothetical protein
MLLLAIPPLGDDVSQERSGLEEAGPEKSKCSKLIELLPQTFGRTGRAQFTDGLKFLG